MADAKVLRPGGGHKIVDITGQRFERLTVIGRDHSRPITRTWWLCQCDCGKQVTVDGYKLKKGHTKSCGCYCADTLSARRKTHGLADKISEYNIWIGMRGRCNNPNNQDYHSYGGRGIAVCERWDHSLEAFLEDMGRRPTPEYSIDRIQNDGNYEPGNCQWATPTQQARNTRKNVHLSVNGEDKILCDAARELGLPPETIMARIKRGVSPERVFSPEDLRCRMLERDGVSKNVKEWCEEFGLVYSSAIRRIGYGWTDPEEILFGRKKQKAA